MSNPAGTIHHDADMLCSQDRDSQSRDCPSDDVDLDSDSRSTTPSNMTDDMIDSNNVLVRPTHSGALPSRAQQRERQNTTSTLTRQHGASKAMEGRHGAKTLNGVRPIHSAWHGLSGRRMKESQRASAIRPCKQSLTYRHKAFSKYSAPSISTLYRDYNLHSCSTFTPRIRPEIHHSPLPFSGIKTLKAPPKPPHPTQRFLTTTKLQDYTYFIPRSPPQTQEKRAAMPSASNNNVSSGLWGELPIWDQIAPRDYTSSLLFFRNEHLNQGNENSHEEAIMASISMALSVVINERPDFAGTVALTAQGTVKRSPAGQIPLTAVYSDGERAGFPSDFAVIEKAGFPQGRLTNRHLFSGRGKLDKVGKKVPISKVNVIFMTGGMALEISVHHCAGGGAGRWAFLEAFSAATMNAPLEHPLQGVNWTTPPILLEKAAAIRRKEGNNFNRLLAKCPEYFAFPGNSGPTQPPPSPEHPKEIQTIMSDRECLIFVFNATAQKKLLARFPGRSFIPLLSSLFWSHVVSARVAAEQYQHPGSDTTVTALDPSIGTENSQIAMPVSWKARLSKPPTPEAISYAGMTIAFPTATVPLSTLQKARVSDAALNEVMDHARTHLSRTIDADFVAARTALFQAAAAGGAGAATEKTHGEKTDIRVLGITHQLECSNHLNFNTWRTFGADLEWGFPVPNGEDNHKNEEEDAEPKTDKAFTMVPHRSVALRKSAPSIGIGSALVLDGREGSDYEVLVSLPQASMRVLVADEEFRKCYSGIIGL